MTNKNQHLNHLQNIKCSDILCYFSLTKKMSVSHLSIYNNTYTVLWKHLLFDESFGALFLLNIETISPPPCPPMSQSSLKYKTHKVYDIHITKKTCSNKIFQQSLWFFLKIPVLYCQRKAKLTKKVEGMKENWSVRKFIWKTSESFVSRLVEMPTRYV